MIIMIIMIGLEKYLTLKIFYEKINIVSMLSMRDNRKDIYSKTANAFWNKIFPPIIFYPQKALLSICRLED